MWIVWIPIHPRCVNEDSWILHMFSKAVHLGYIYTKSWICAKLRNMKHLFGSSLKCYHWQTTVLIPQAYRRLVHWKTCFRHTLTTRDTTTDISMLEQFKYNQPSITRCSWSPGNQRRQCQQLWTCYLQKNDRMQNKLLCRYSKKYL